MLLEIKNLSLQYVRGKKTISALRDVSLTVDKEETLGLVGESGCGKSSVAHSILRLIPGNEGKITQGEIFFEGQELLQIAQEKIRQIRGKEIAIIFQDPFTSLNPVIPIGKQIEENILTHSLKISSLQLKEKIFSLLEEVQLKETERIYNSYPHQISGGQRQRAMIAMALANRPKLLICDEPTTALDVTVQKEIMELLMKLQKTLKISILFITHHFGLIGLYTQKLAVLYGGEIVEEGNTQEILKNPQHPYTQSLLKSLPKKNLKKEKLPVIPGSPPDLSSLPSGCIFHPRCPKAIEECKKKVPLLRELEKFNRKISCDLAPFS